MSRVQENAPFRRVAYATYLLASLFAAVASLEGSLRLLYGSARQPLDSGTYRREASPPDDLPQEFVLERIRQPPAPFSATLSLYGCRHPGTLDSVKLRQGRITTLFLGDSFTFGWGVEDDETFGALFGARTGTLSQTLVCGGYGRGTRYHIRQLRRVLKAEPSIERVAYQLFGNDLMEDFAVEGSHDEPASPGPRSKWRQILPMTRAYVLGPLTANLRRVFGPAPSPEDRARHLFPDYAPVLQDGILPAELRMRRQEDFIAFRRSFAELAALVRSRGARLVVFVMPYAFRFEPEAEERIGIRGLWDRASYEAYLANVREVVMNEGAEYLDLEPTFLQERARHPRTALFLPRDLHLSREGNKLVADALVRALEEEPAGRSPAKP